MPHGTIADTGPASRTAVQFQTRYRRQRRTACNWNIFGGGCATPALIRATWRGERMCAVRRYQTWPTTLAQFVRPGTRPSFASSPTKWHLIAFDFQFNCSLGSRRFDIVVYFEFGETLPPQGKGSLSRLIAQQFLMH